MIDTRIKTFMTVAKTKNFTRAAELLNLTQPAVYQQIQYLENYYGVKLVKREGRSLKLTEEGKFFLQYAKEVTALSAEMEHNIRNSSTLIERRHNIAATMTIGGYVIPPIIGAYKNNYRNVNITLIVNNTNVILKKLIDREIELGIIEGPFDKIKFKYKKFKDDELVLVVSSQHIFAKQDIVNLEDVLKGKLLLRERGSGTREIFESELVRKGYSIDTISTCTEIGNIKAIVSLVEANVGYTVISREAVRKEIKEGTLVTVPIKDFDMHREFNFVYLHDKEIGFINEFIDFCSRYS